MKVADRVLLRIVAARDVRLSAESRFQWNSRKTIASFRGDRPRPNVSGTEGSELPKRFIVEIPAGVPLGDGTRQTRTVHYRRYCWWLTAPSSRIAAIR